MVNSHEGCKPGCVPTKHELDCKVAHPGAAARNGSGRNGYVMPDDLRSRFGCVEFESIMADILNFCEYGEPPMVARMCGTGDPGEGLKKKFLIDVSDDAAIFAAMCANGLIENVYWPKRLFRLTDKAILLLEGQSKNQAPSVLR